MKKVLSLLIILLATQSALGQDNLVFKQFGLDTNSALIAVCPFYDKQKAYKNYTFYIDKKEDLKKVSQTLSHGNKIKADTVDDDLNIYIIKDKEVLPIQIGASPKYSYLNIEEDYYAFDISQLLKLAKDYPLSYTAKVMKFKKEEEFNAFLKKYNSYPNFLCFEDITEELEGICPIAVKITTKDKPASKGWEIIENDLKKLGAKKDEDYIISYKPNFDNTGTYHYEVRLSKKLYDKLNNPAYTKGKWTMNLKEIITYWKK
jgi:hypothetical protein